MSKNLRLKILKYINANGGEYESVDLVPVILKNIKKIKRTNIKAVLKDLQDEGFIEADWKGLSFLNNVDGSTKRDNEINATAKIKQKGINYLLEQSLKSKQIKLTLLSIIYTIMLILIAITGFSLKNEIGSLKSKNIELEKKINRIENNIINSKLQKK